jgi:Kdo2-lipid IVA lauroyltransferase/acyltransferase
MTSRAPLGAAPAPIWFRLAAALIAVVPYRALPPLGTLLGFFVGSILRIRRRHAVEALRRAGIEPAARIASRVYASLGRGVAELLWVAGRPPAVVDARFAFEPEAERAVRDALALGKGLVVATAHTGNWDLGACAAARWLASERLASSLTVVTKRLANRALDRAWQRLRAERGVVLVEASGATRAVSSALARGGVVALLVDQRPDRERHVAAVPFLGASAPTDLAPALLAARAGAPIVILFSRRLADGSHRMSLGGVVQPEDLRGGRPSLVAATERIAHALDTFVRAHPDQWLWLHRRWGE